MRTYNVTTGFGEKPTAIDVYPAQTLGEDGSAQQQLDGSQVPLWAVDLLVKQEDSATGLHRKSEVVTVKFPSRTAPEIKTGDLVSFDGLVVGSYATNGNAGLYFRAASAMGLPA